MVAAARRGEEGKTIQADPAAAFLPEPGRCNNTAMRRAMRRVSQIYDAALAPSGLRSTQRSILVSIARAGNPSMGELAAVLVLDRSALAHNLKPLEREGLIKLAADVCDKRSKRVTLTAKGRIKLRQSMAHWEQAQRKLESALGVDKARRLRATLDYIASLEFDDPHSKHQT
jgi:DNA-binding MarR family transcriptional regulator